MRKLISFITIFFLVALGLTLFLTNYNKEVSQVTTIKKQTENKIWELPIVKPKNEKPRLFSERQKEISPQKLIIPIEETPPEEDNKRLRKRIEEERKEFDKQTYADLAMQHEWMMTHDPQTGNIPRERLYKAYKYMKELQAQAAIEKTTAAIPGVVWNERGPTNQGGRTRAFMLDPNDPTHRSVFAASVSGGIWKTNDIWAANPNWQSLDDFMDNLAVTTLAYDPTNTQVMYAGTGEGWYNLDAVRGAGIFKSTDGGNTWTQITPATANGGAFYYVQKIVVTSTGTVLAATRGAAGTGGIYRSTDGGTTWTRVLGTGTARGADIEIAGNGDIYASLGIFYSDGIYKSVNDGVTWNQSFNATGVAERIEIACAPSNSNIVYAMLQTAGGSSIGDIIRSTDGGVNWVSVSGGLPLWSDCGNNGGLDFSRGQAWYDLILAVDPLNPNTVWAGGVDLMRTTDGGANWTQMTSWCGFTYPEMHADHHALLYFPGQSDTLLFGNDGGIYTSTNASAANPTYTVKNDNYRTLQLYSCALHPTAGSDYALGGAQDNGSHQWSSAGLGPTVEVSGGDGAFAHIDQNEPQYQFTAYVYNNYFRSTNGGATFNSLGAANPGNVGQFINPTDYDNTANKLYAAANTNQYIRWDDPQTGTSFTTVSPAGFTGDVTAVTCDPNTVNRVWFGMNNGNVYIVDNAHINSPTVTNVTGASMPGSAVSCIEIENGNANHVLVTFSSYGVNSVWETTDGGNTWRSVEGNLPDMPVRWALFNPNNNTQALIATELGVWSTDNLNGTATNWQPSNVGMANVRTDMLQIRTSDNLVIAATHGRGLFETRVFMTNYAEFTTASTSVNERDATTFFPSADPKNCMKYIDVNIPIKINRAPDADATIDITVDTTSTAIINKDFEVLTPTLTIPASTANLTFDVIVRIYDDPFQEDYFTPETIILNMTVTNSLVSNLQDGSQLQHTVYITSDDYEPALKIVGEQQVGTGTIADVIRTPFRGSFEDERMQILYLASELSGTGIPANATLTGIAFYVNTKNSTTDYQNYNVKLLHTTSTGLTAYETAGAVTCFSGTVTTTAGWNYLDFNQNFFTWNGTDNLIVEICFDNPNGVSSSADEILASDPAGSTRMIYIRDNGISGCASNTVQYSSTQIPNIRFKYRSPAPVQTTVNQSSADSLYVLSNEIIHFYDASGNVIATLSNANFDPGCTKIYVERSGTTAQPFWYNNPANYLADKTYLANVANNNSTGRYDLTLYYTPAEVNGWITTTASGYTWADADIIKIPGPISGVSPSNPFPYGTANEIITAPVTGTYSSADFTIAGTFTTGFSGFGVGVPGTPPPLAISLLEFTGKYINNYNKIQWRTGAENNVQSFVLERKTEGETQFSTINEVNARGGVAFGTDYSYNDFNIKPATKYYYRLKSVEADGTVEYSNIIEVFTGERDAFARIFPVPAEENLYLRTFLPQEDNILLEIYDLKGNKVSEQTWENLSEGNHTLQINTDKLSEGNYLLKISLPKSGITETRKAILK